MRRAGHEKRERLPVARRRLVVLVPYVHKVYALFRGMRMIPLVDE
eukprot:XP_001705410.1 Hypothetical protein GL50803_39278 [Giardia lamblia ATCC 50803]